MDKPMQTTAFSRNWKVASLVLLSPALATVSQAQFYLSYATPTLWLDPSSIQASGGSVTAWDNKIGGAIGNLIGASGTQPTVSGSPLNGNSTVTFNGADQILINT